MRFAGFRIAAVVAAFALVFAAPAAAQDRWSFDAAIGPSFGNIGTSFAARGSATLAVTDRVWLGAEAGMLPHVPFDRADDLATPLPGMVPATDFRVNGYHVNANVRAIPFAWDRVAPYVTAGVGTFISDTIGTSHVAGVRLQERGRATDFATNIGAGVSYPVTEWLGLNGDYRTFLLHRDGATPRVHRLTTGVTSFLR